MKKLRILIDCDGVLSNYVQEVIKFINRETSTIISMEDITAWDPFEQHGFQHLKEKFENEYFVPGSCLNMDPFPHAKESVPKLKQFGEILIVTAPELTVPTWDYERRKWLQNHFDIHHSHVIFASAKHAVQGDIFIDDRPDNVENWQLHHHGKALLWDAPYNRDNKFLHRISSWQEVHEIAEHWHKKINK